MGATNTSQLRIQLTTDGEGNVVAAIANVASSIKEIRPAANEASNALEEIKKNVEALKAAMEAWGVYEVLKEAIAGFIEANVEASTLTAILVGVTGSASTAADTLEQLGEVARNSTTGIGEIVDAYVRLRNAGLEPTAETMQQLANIAAMTNTNLGTVANAMAMAAEGSTRSLKELGITAQSAGDQLVVTFRGVPEVIENSAAGITAYIQKLGEMPEALAAQEARLATITGRWDQLKKGAADFAVAINQGDTSLSGIVDKMTVFLQLM